MALASKTLKLILFRYEPETKIVTVPDETSPVLVNVTLPNAIPLHVSENLSLGENKPVMEEHEDDEPLVMKKPLIVEPSYTSKLEFDTRFTEIERSLSTLVEKKTYSAETGTSADDITVLKISKEVNLS